MGRNMEIDAEITLRTLVGQRDRLLKEIEALRNQVAGIGIAIELISPGSAASASSSGGRVRVSETLIELLRESGDAGLTPKAALELASRRGINLNRGSVYSLLNRMVGAGTVVHENSHYRLTEFSSRREGDFSHPSEYQ